MLQKLSFIIRVRWIWQKVLKGAFLIGFLRGGTVGQNGKICAMCLLGLVMFTDKAESVVQTISFGRRPNH